MTKMTVISIRKHDCKVTQYFYNFDSNEFGILFYIAVESPEISLTVYCYENYKEIVIFQLYFEIEMLRTFLVKVTIKTIEHQTYDSADTYKEYSRSARSLLGKCIYF
jgi:hypothetical protein